MKSKISVRISKSLDTLGVLDENSCVALAIVLAFSTELSLLSPQSPREMTSIFPKGQNSVYFHDDMLEDDPGVSDYCPRPSR